MSDRVIGYISAEEADFFCEASSYSSPPASVQNELVPSPCIHNKVASLCVHCYASNPLEEMCIHWKIQDKCTQCSKK